jgi:hypothetical protein
MLVKAFTCFVLTCDAAKLSIFTRLATRCSSLLLLPTTLPLLGAAAAADDDDDDEAGGALGEDSAGADAGAADAAVGAATAAGVSEAAPADALNSDIRKDGIGVGTDLQIFRSSHAMASCEPFAASVTFFAAKSCFRDLETEKSGRRCSMKSSRFADLSAPS